jgi:SAM-dependent methyltransferase
MNGDEVKLTVRKHYAAVARKGSGCCPSCGCLPPEEVGRAIGYSEEELATAPDANLGLGCGNPLALGQLAGGEAVLDLGSGAGFDCILAAGRVGPSGRVIGVDMTDEMLERARANARKLGLANVEFRKGSIDDLPVEDGSIDVVISNCVINLAPDKAAVFREAHRVLRPGGRMHVSDIVLLAELTAEQRNDPELVAGCVGGALLRDLYIKTFEEAGFEVAVIQEDRDIAKAMYGGLPVASLKLRATRK